MGQHYIPSDNLAGTAVKRRETPGDPSKVGKMVEGLRADTCKCLHFGRKFELLPTAQLADVLQSWLLH